MWTDDDSNNILNKLNRIETNGVARARVLQAEIEHLRANLTTCYDDEKPWKMALLASLDAEMARVCALPGVMNALYGDAEQAP